MDGLELTIDTREFDQSLERVLKQARRDLAPSVVRETGEKALKRSKQKTPVLTGVLKASQKLDVASKGDTIEGTLSSDVSYAFTVHEDLEATHDDGESKFLEKALRESRGDFRVDLIQGFGRLK